MYAVLSNDELIDRSGRIRAPWAPVIGAVHDIGPEELARRALALNRKMHLAAPFGTTDRRHYDPLPAVLTASEFGQLEAGLRQRARLLNAALEDLYGPQMLLQEGYLPPALVLGSPHFLRSLHMGPLHFPRLSLLRRRCDPRGGPAVPGGARPYRGDPRPRPCADLAPAGDQHVAGIVPRGRFAQPAPGARNADRPFAAQCAKAGWWRCSPPGR